MMLARSLPALRLRPAAARTMSTSEALSLSSHRSIKVAVSDGVQLHTFVPVDDHKDKTPVVCLPSAFGGVREDFAKQFEALSESYALVGVDPRGYGQSRPPRRDFPERYFERDADDVMRVVDQLGFDKFALLGWSAGANTSAVLSGKFPDRVSRLVLVAGNAFVSDEDVEVFDKVEDVSKWSRAQRERSEAIYGAEKLQAGWSTMCNALRTIYENDGGNLYCEWLPRIRCKTLVVSGGKDKMIADFHGEYLSERIVHSRLQVVPEGRHDLVIERAQEFNALLDAFLQEPDDKLTQSREFVAVPAKK